MQAKLAKPPHVVLIVEDEPLVRLTGADLLGEAGFEVLEAANADEALRILEATPEVRVVFSDVEMPGSLDGLGLARRVCRRWPSIELSSPPAIVSVRRRFRAKAGSCQSLTTERSWCVKSKKLWSNRRRCAKQVAEAAPAIHKARPKPGALCRETRSGL